MDLLNEPSPRRSDRVAPDVRAGLALLVAAVITGLFGFGVVSDEALQSAKPFSAFFLFAAAAAFWWEWIMRSPPRATSGR